MTSDTSVMEIIEMECNMNNEELDEMQRHIQEALSQAKRDTLHDKYGMEFEYTDSRLPPDVENEWLDQVLEFERQFEQARSITVRERIGDPPLQPLNDLPLYAVGEAVTTLLDLLADHGIAVDFLGDVDDIEAYRYLTEELLDEEMDDIRIDGMVLHFTHSTPEYDVQMWVENFVLDLFTQDREYFLPGLAKQPLFDSQGEPITAPQFQQKIEAVWERLPPTNRVTTEPITVRVEGDEAKVWAIIAWNDETQRTKGQVESYFRLQPSPYTGWDVVQTSLLDDILA
jgi:hypothetical protein